MGKLLGGEKGGAGLVVDYGDAKAFGRSWRVRCAACACGALQRLTSSRRVQGFRKHQVVDPLSEPGHTDLTANVDFSYLAEALGDLGKVKSFLSPASPMADLRSCPPFSATAFYFPRFPYPATSHGPLPQSTFLTSLGLQPRLAGLLRAASPERRKEIESAAQRLVDSTSMGSQYKVMGITPKREGAEVGECFPFVKEGPAEGEKSE